MQSRIHEGRHVGFYAPLAKSTACTFCQHKLGSDRKWPSQISGDVKLGYLSSARATHFLLRYQNRTHDFQTPKASFMGSPATPTYTTLSRLPINRAYLGELRGNIMGTLQVGEWVQGLGESINLMMSQRALEASAEPIHPLMEGPPLERFPVGSLPSTPIEHPP